MCSSDLVDEVVTAALQEDVQGIAVSSYQGGHTEYFSYMVDLLKARGGAHIHGRAIRSGPVCPDRESRAQPDRSPAGARRSGERAMASECKPRSGEP